ncbi:CCA tRNA nucleotidyltransferase [Candidatus Haliotispira prima]|uniref:CCA tRNA nucleotidyltransferase n=1 Tax=Candidatus Haliotispira prima TaxID=3034016 RepID=A0ABY8MK37_9SPIO|nr:CCA tRNA nucleotidyltransferase [Candidatus Haliotispira prima]
MPDTIPAQNLSYDSSDDSSCAFSLTVPQDLAQDLLTVLQRLQQANHQVVIVGGALRDCLLGHSSSDYDLAGTALPEQVQKLFRRCVPTGLQHGTVTIMQRKNSYQITTFRSDGIYKDGRRPESVEFTNDLSGDLARRDFTINALAFEPDPQVVGERLKELRAAGNEPTAKTMELPGRLYDPHGGRRHLQQRLICAIGRADMRFEEDALRMLRACRFSAKLGFAIEPLTLEAMRKLHPNLAKVSKPRVQEELRKLLLAPFALDGLRYLTDSGLWGQIFPPSFPPPVWAPQNHKNGQHADGTATLERIRRQWSELPEPIGHGTQSSSQQQLCQGTDNLPALLLQKAREHDLQNSPYLRWHSEQVPAFSFAWILLHLSLLQTLPEAPSQNSSQNLNQADNRKAVYHKTEQTLEQLLRAKTGLSHKTDSTAYDQTISRTAAEGLDSLLCSNREKNGALYILAHSALVWGPHFLCAYAYPDAYDYGKQPAAETDLATSGAERSILLRSFLALFGPGFSLPALCLLGFSGQAAGKELWAEFCDDLLKVIAREPALSVKELAIDGRVLARDCGIPAGPGMGRLLQKLFRHVLLRPEDNQPEILQRIACDIHKESYEENH